jgi:hypothetical protein
VVSGSERHNRGVQAATFSHFFPFENSTDWVLAPGIREFLHKRTRYGDTLRSQVERQFFSLIRWPKRDGGRSFQFRLHFRFMSVRGFEHVLFRLTMIGDIIETSRHRNDIIGSCYVGRRKVFATHWKRAARITHTAGHLERSTTITIATAL